MIVYFIYKRETKGAYFYQEVNADGEEVYAQNGAVVQSMYIRKSAVKGERPESFEIDLPIE